MIRRLASSLAGLLFFATAALAADSPRDVWVKAKCALCHGMDGSGRTDTGRKVSAPDVRAPQTQSRTDEALAKIISGGHKRMPSFRKQVSATNARLLVEYIRGLVKVAAVPSER